MRRAEADQTADAIRDRPPERVIHGRNWTKADILVYRAGSGRVAVKDYGPRAWWVRQTLGRWLVRRECAAYRALDGLDGVPPFVGRLGPWSLATGLVPGAPLAERPAAASDPAVFDRLDALLGSIHARGVALGDLHHRDVLVGDDGRVWVVDLATAVVSRPRWLLDRLRAADRHAAVRLRRRHLPETTAGLTDDPAAAARHRRGRRLKRLWDGLRGKR